MKPDQSPITTGKAARSPGERAFDLCFLPVAILFLAGIVMKFVALPRSPWVNWIFFVLGIAIAVLWFRALRAIIGAWRDPAARVLRFTALALLIPLGLHGYYFLAAPFIQR